MSRYIQKTAALAALLVACASLASAASAALTLSDPIPVGPHVRIGKLDNGLTYYIQNNGKPEKKLELRLVVKAGSILEDDDQQGLAHFTEHMAFNGSTHFKKHELISYLQSIGVKFGADLNAYTSFDETVYTLPIPTDKSGNVEQGFLVLENWAHGVLMSDADIDMERAIVLEEARNRKGAGERINKIVMPKMYNGSRYAQRLPIGQEDIIRTFKPDALRRFYRDWYRPDLMAVVVVGDIDPVRAEGLVKAHFGGLRNPLPARPRADSPIPVRSNTEAVVVTDPEASGNTVMIRYPVRPARDETSFADYRDKLVRALFGAMMGNRLEELAQQARPPFMAGASGHQHLTARYETYFSMAALGKGGAEPAISALVQENQRARQFGFNAAELERGKKNLMRSFERMYNEREKTDSGAYAGELIRNFLEREAVPGIENEYNYARELVPGILLAEMNRYARENIPSDSGKLVLYTGSDKAEMPAPKSEQLLAWVDAAATVKLAAREEKQLAAGLMDKPPAAGSIVAESENKALGLTTLTLSNGVKVILKPTDFANEQIYLSASRPGGMTRFGEPDIVNARYAHAVVASMGIKDLSPLDLQKVMAGKAAAVTTGFSAYHDAVGGFAGSTDIDLMLQMLYLKFTSVRRDADLYTSFLGNQVESARNLMAQPQAVFADAVVTATYGTGPWVPRPPRVDDFARLNLERSIALYKERFSSARGLTFIIVGNFDIAKIKPLIATYMASLPTADLPVDSRDVGVRPVRGIVRKAVFSGVEAKSQVAINFGGDAVYSRPEAMRLRALVDVMNIRITDILREKLTLIYGGGMGGTLERVPYGHYAIGAALPTGPANVDKVIAALFAEIAQMKESGPLAADLDKVKQNWIQVHRRALRENRYWLGQLQAAVLDDTDPAVMLTYEARVAALTAREVQEAAKRYFDLDNYVQVVLYPEKK